MTETTATSTRKPRTRKTGDPRADAAIAEGAAVAAKLSEAEAAETATEGKLPDPGWSVAGMRRDVDQLIIEAAGQIVEQHVPEAFRAEIGQMIANQLHHLSTPKTGWPGTLPKPARSDWR